MKIFKRPARAEEPTKTSQYDTTVARTKPPKASKSRASSTGQSQRDVVEKRPAAQAASATKWSPKAVAAQSPTPPAQGQPSMAPAQGQPSKTPESPYPWEDGAVADDQRGSWFSKDRMDEAERAVQHQVLTGKLKKCERQYKDENDPHTVRARAQLKRFEAQTERHEVRADIHDRVEVGVEEALADIYFSEKIGKLLEGVQNDPEAAAKASQQLTALASSNAAAFAALQSFGRAVDASSAPESGTPTGREMTDAEAARLVAEMLKSLSSDSERGFGVA